MSAIIDVGGHLCGISNQFATENGRCLSGGVGECGPGRDAVADEEQVNVVLRVGVHRKHPSTQNGKCCQE